MQNKDLNAITNMANTSLYSIRNQCEVYNVDNRRLSKPVSDGSEPKFVSLTQIDSQDFEVEVIYHSDFFSKVLSDIGLKKYIDIPEDMSKLETCLTKIGAMCTDTHSMKQTKFIKLEVLISAMRIHKY